MCRVRSALIVLSFSFCAHLTLASDLYSLDSHGTSDGTIYKLNQSTAAETLVGPVGPAFGFPFDLASDPYDTFSTLRIWSCDITSNTLLKIDPTTGLGTPIGTFRTFTGAPVKIVSLAFYPSKGLFGTTANTYSGEADHLYSITSNNAITTPVDPGIGIGFNDVFALGFDNDGRLYGVSNATHQLISIDTFVGFGSAIGPVGPQAISDIATRPEDGVTFAVNASTNELYTIDLHTGATTLVGAHTTADHNMVGLAFGRPVPEPGTFTLLALGAAIATLRRKR